MSRDNSWDAFVIAWEESNSVDEVVEKLGISKWSVHNTAAKLRKMGVELKQMRKNPIRGEVDVAALNNLIKSKRSA